MTQADITGSLSCTEITDVSRTVQSSDLFTPYREPRVTLSTIGVYQQRALPFGGKYWGGPLTEYGGIGGLTFVGRQRVRDLEVTRSHRHYRSGLSKYLTDIQPYRRTGLHLSECRVNDQILPAPLQADISRLNWQREHPWPDSQAYGTHRSIFEVFPSVKPDRSLSEKEAVYNSRSVNVQPLVKSTQSALLELNRKLYQTTLYQDSYRNHCRQYLSLPISLLPRQQGLHQQQHPSPDRKPSDVLVSSLPLSASGKDKENIDEEETDDVEGVIDEYKGEEHDEGDEEAGEDCATNLTNDLKKSYESADTDTPQIMENTIRHFEITPNKPMMGVGPCWPPGSSYVIENINGAQMLERADITQSQPAYHIIAKPTGEKKQRRLLSARVRFANRFGDIVASDNSQGSTSSSVATLMSQDAILKERMQQLRVQDDDQHPSNQTCDKSASANHNIASPSTTDHVGKRVTIKLPAVQSTHEQTPFLTPSSFHDRIHKLGNISLPSPFGAAGKPKTEPVERCPDVPGTSWKGKVSIVLPPAPLADCLSPAGTRTPHKLGLRYKSEAHKRYYLVHPDIIPDLRTNINEGKKYFFYNFHSSVYRG